MICEIRLLTILKAPHVSEKASAEIEKKNIIVFKVIKNANKSEIKAAILKLFQVQVKCVNTLIIKGKVKRHNNQIGYRNNWKKAYITLKKGEHWDFISKQE